MGVAVIDGVNTCEVCSGPVELYDTEEGWVHKFGARQLCRPKIAYVPSSTRFWEATLRDRFAMAALTGLVMKQTILGAPMAEVAYRIADSMLEERKRETQTDRRDDTAVAGSGVRVPLGSEAGETAGGEEIVTGETGHPSRRSPSEHD